MKLIVGLGNPGYQGTRHNIGFMVIDKIVKQLNLTKKEKFNGAYYEYVNEEKIIFLKPLSYMNLSGEVIKKYIDYFKVNKNDILIIFDDMDMDIGKVRIREQGSSGGHNGIKNVISHLKTDRFKRIKVGIGRHNNNSKDHVLGKFSKRELKIIDDSTEKVIKICFSYIDGQDFLRIISNYNNIEKE